MIRPLEHVLLQVNSSKLPRTHDLSHFACDNGFPDDRKVTIWMLFFTWSKVFELFDTILILLMKKPLILLQWYHHMSTLYLCFYGYKTQEMFSRVMAVFNYWNHTWMYGLFAVKSLGVPVPKWVNLGITASQITHMSVAVYLSLTALIMKVIGKECNASTNFMMAAFFIFTSFLVLFLNFFWKTYFNRRKTVNFKGD